ncbi:MAG: ATP-dependent DNA ligase [Methanomicrobiaceae archaeon]|nr:ATP-dependent DNA ligase [Methanomicrobiaceae archaeon]
MKFSSLVSFFERLEETASQIEMTEILADLFEKASEEDIDIVCYFVLGNIAPGYSEADLGLGDKTVISALALGSGRDEEEVSRWVRDKGTLSALAADLEIPWKEGFRDYIAVEDGLRVEDVHDALMQIATASGSGSMKKKKIILGAMLAAADAKERYYITRLATGTMRLGAGDRTLLDGMSYSISGTKEHRPVLEHAYYTCSDIGHVAKVLKRSGISGVKKIRVSLNRPIRPMLTQRVGERAEIPEKITSARIAAEEKYDGERIEAHKDGDDIHLFSRRLTDITGQFPDVVEEVRSGIDATTAIIDGEVVAYDAGEGTYQPFQQLMHRRRKYHVKEYAEKVPARYVVFDLLYLNGNSKMSLSYPERRAQLKKILTPSDFLSVSGMKVCASAEEIHDAFSSNLKRGLEGVICKSCASDSVYEPGNRSWQWIKWKKEYETELTDTLDLVIIGAAAGKGKRSGRYGSVLCAAYNEEEDVFQTVCSVGTGFSDEELEALPGKLEDCKREKKPSRCQVRNQSEPDFWFSPEFVIEVLGSEITRSPAHTCNWDDDEKRGFALRFPRFIRWRPEKSPEQATSAEEIAQMYGQQGS